MMRNATLDYARLVAAFGIVAFHSGVPGAGIGYSGLAFFLILLATFGFPQKRAASLGKYTKARALRMLLPWFGWSILYGLSKLAEVMLFGKSVGDEIKPWMLATGPELHLWFLPFAFLCGFILWFLWPLHHNSQGQPRSTYIAIAFATLAICLPIVTPSKDFTPPFEQYLFALPAFFLGLAFAFQANTRNKVMIMIVLTCALFAFGKQGGELQLTIAGWTVLLCFALPMPTTKTSEFAAALSLTVYLAHPLVLALTARVLHLPFKHLPLFFIGLSLTVALGAALHLVLRRQPAGNLWRGLLGV
jgi:peptidoglycan/LPS O-acetylase OafA/YrhL